MRYRQDVPLGTDLQRIARHVVEHLAGAVTMGDQPTVTTMREVHVEIRRHPDADSHMMSVIGEIPGTPLAPYLLADFDPAADHPDISFTPYEEPDLGHHADADAWEHWTTRGHHERVGA